MISLSQARQFAEDSPSVKAFRPWWEFGIDYVVQVTLLTTLLAWARVISMDASGVVCIAAAPNTAFGYVFALYANPRCSQEFDANLLLYYPYILFFQWLVAFLIQRSWLKVPTLVTKFDDFYETFLEMVAIAPKFRLNAQSLHKLPELKYEGENLVKVKALQKKMMLLLTDRSYLVLIYGAKVISFFALCILSLAFMITWVSQVHFFSSDFLCNLKGSSDTVAYDKLYCHVAPAYFMYGIMIINTVIQLLIIIFSVRGMYFIFKQRTFAVDSGLFGEMKEDYIEEPGFRDLQFCIALIRTNIRDGNLMFTVIKSCLSENSEWQQPEGQVGTSNGDTDAAESMKPAVSPSKQHSGKIHPLSGK